MEGDPMSDCGVGGNIISFCGCSCCFSNSLFSGLGVARMTSSSRGSSFFCPGTNECDRDTPMLTTGALMAAAKSSSALNKNNQTNKNSIKKKRFSQLFTQPDCCEKNLKKNSGLNGI